MERNANAGKKQKSMWRLQPESTLKQATGREQRRLRTEHVAAKWNRQRDTTYKLTQHVACGGRQKKQRIGHFVERRVLLGLRGYALQRQTERASERDSRNEIGQCYEKTNPEADRESGHR